MRAILGTILLIILTLSTTFLNARDLRKMSKEKRNEILIKEAKRAIMKYGPAYYREVAPPVIALADEGAVENVIDTYQHRKSLGDNLEHDRWVEKAMKGKRWYEVTIPYDFTVETFNADFAISVFIWADTHEAFCINFGTYKFITDLDERAKRGEVIKEEEFKKRPPREIFLKDIRVNR